MKQRTRFGKCIAKSMIDHGLTLKKLSERMEYSPAMVCSLTRGYKHISNIHLKRFMEALPEIAVQELTEAARVSNMCIRQEDFTTEHFTLLVELASLPTHTLKHMLEKEKPK